jgi:cytoskeletal protein RodZ
MKSLTHWLKKLSIRWLLELETHLNILRWQFMNRRLTNSEGAEAKKERKANLKLLWILLLAVSFWMGVLVVIALIAGYFK